MELESPSIKTEFYGLTFQFRLGDPLIPGEKVPSFKAKAVRNCETSEISQDTFIGKNCLIFFYSQDFSDCCESTFGLIADMQASKEVDLEYVVISTDSIEVHQIFAETRGLGVPKATIVSDKNGNIAKAFGVLDKRTHSAYNSLFLIDKNGVVQGSRVSGSPNVPVVLSGIEDLLDTVTDAFS